MDAVCLHTSPIQKSYSFYSLLHAEGQTQKDLALQAEVLQFTQRQLDVVAHAEDRC